MNGDGHVDALLITFDDPVLEVHLGDGDGGFEGPVASFDLPRADVPPFTHVDFDGDGLQDVLLRKGDGMRPLYGHSALGLTLDVDPTDGPPEPSTDTGGPLTEPSEPSEPSDANGEGCSCSAGQAPPTMPYVGDWILRRR